MARPAELARRAEAACLRGWPALRGVLFDGWVLRFSEGHTRRSNSVTPMAAGTRELRDKIAHCEALYASAGLPPIFRIPTIAEPGLDAALDARGYAGAEDETCVIYRDFGRRHPPERSDAEIVEGIPGEPWLAAHERFTGSDVSARGAQRKILNGRMDSVAFGAVHDRIVCNTMNHPASPQPSPPQWGGEGWTRVAGG